MHWEDKKFMRLLLSRGLEPNLQHLRDMPVCRPCLQVLPTAEGRVPTRPATARPTPCSCPAAPLWLCHMLLPLQELPSQPLTLGPLLRCSSGATTFKRPPVTSLLALSEAGPFLVPMWCQDSLTNSPYPTPAPRLAVLLSAFTPYQGALLVASAVSPQTHIENPPTMCQPLLSIQW